MSHKYVAGGVSYNINRSVYGSSVSTHKFQNAKLLANAIDNAAIEKVGKELEMCRQEFAEHEQHHKELLQERAGLEAENTVLNRERVGLAYRHWLMKYRTVS